jgi:hypothetical protein
MKFIHHKQLHWATPSWMQRLWSGLFAGLLCFLSLVGYPLMAWADELPPADEPSSVLVRTNLDPKNPVVGQQLEYQVDVFVDTWFAKAPAFPEIQVEDAIALLPATASININERINGKPYAGQRRTYFLFPQLPGRYTVPELSIKVSPAQPGSSTPEPITLSTEPIDFMASLPPELAAQSDGPILATPQLLVKIQLATQGNGPTTQLRKLHTGDTVEQTVTMVAKDTLASVLPAISVPDIPGLAAYPDPLKLTNQFDRGQFTASRTEHISYVAEQPGRYQVPEQAFVWWNTQSQSLQTEVIPALTIRVQPTAEQFLLELLPWLAGLLGIIGAAIYFRQTLLTRWQRYRQHRRESEPAQWQRLQRACLSNDPKATWDSLTAWLGSFQPSRGISTPEDLVNQTGSADLAASLTELETVLFNREKAPAASSSWTGNALYKALKAARKHELHQTQSEHQTTMDLPLLNPPL